MPQFDEHLPICWAGCNWPHVNWVIDHGALFLIPLLCTWIIFGTKAKGR